MLLAVCVLHENKVIFGRFLTRLHYKKDFFIMFTEIVDHLHDETRNVYKSIDHKKYKISYYYDFGRKLLFMLINEIYDNTETIQEQISELYGNLIEVFKTKSAYNFNNQERDDFIAIIQTILDTYNQKMTKLDFYEIPIKRPTKKVSVEIKANIPKTLVKPSETGETIKVEEKEVIMPIDVVLVSRNDGKFLVSLSFNKRLDKLFSNLKMGPETVAIIKEVLIQSKLETLVVSKGNLFLTAIYGPNLKKEQIEEQAMEALNSFIRIYDEDVIEEWDGDNNEFSGFKNILESQFNEFLYYLENPDD